MKRLKRLIGTLAVLSCGAFAAVALTSSPQVGTLVSDAEAGTIRGGCQGCSGFECNLYGCGGLLSFCDCTVQCVLTTIHSCDSSEPEPGGQCCDCYGINMSYYPCTR
jgi:hypothetical protein